MSQRRGCAGSDLIGRAVRDARAREGGRARRTALLYASAARHSQSAFNRRRGNTLYPSSETKFWSALRPPEGAGARSPRIVSCFKTTDPRCRIRQRGDSRPPSAARAGALAGRRAPPAQARSLPTRELGRASPFHVRVVNPILIKFGTRIALMLRKQREYFKQIDP
ncbi:hypothetical protein EVAR_65635_1 [Eumeta japonica]|uniref:Uncharacterized protein n=1 Tax=Eumeta variegata TaxID=151549 RepID=A0A4C1ZAA3_EUMVA|nr:hypothetical protein EVAR_65635_1 [Eumeta japonica]